MTKKQKQAKECNLKKCPGFRCGCTCCDDDEVEEWIVEYCVFHERMKDFLISKGIKIEFCDDRVRFKNCSDGKKCKFLKYALNKEIDPRPIDCKIYPFAVDWHTIDFEKRLVNIMYCDYDCPLIKTGEISKSFKDDVVKILRRDFSMLFYGMEFIFKFKNGTVDKKYERLHGWVK